MFIIEPKYILKCDEKFTILKNQAFVFDDKIIEINSLDKLKQKYQNAKILKTKPNSLVLPAFINTHTHLEFSANTSKLKFGNFLLWLNSVIKHRTSLNQKANDELLENKIEFLRKTGTGTIGEISSFSSDLKACVKASKNGLRIVFFNELLGLSNIKEKKEEFLKRFENSLKYKSELFTPALSIHSAYSTSKELVEFAISLAKKEKLLLSTHFLESKEEYNFLTQNKGPFKKWLDSFSNLEKEFTPETYLKLFENMHVLFTHCTYLNLKHDLLNKNLHFITHCPMSNRLLGKKRLNLKQAFKNNLNIHLATDGLSSNTSLSMLDELRAALLTHCDLELNFLAKKLLLMATSYAAKALKINSGSIEPGKNADFSVFEFDEDEQIALQFILRAKYVDDLFINGKRL